MMQPDAAGAPSDWLSLHLLLPSVLLMVPIFTSSLSALPLLSLAPLLFKVGSVD